MIKVVGVSFKQNGQAYFFSPNKLDLKKGDNVIVETERGLQYGTLQTDIIEIDEKKIVAPLKQVIRIATKDDYYTDKKNKKNAEFALQKARELIDEMNINMQLIEASYTFDKEQLIFKFLSDNRVDFRDLVKELASIFHTRIELRQIGARDKAKETGGCGVCGRKLCCSSFLKDMESVSITMAKNQNLSLNPTKINGLCGRLLCCLKYEDSTYCELKVGLPQTGKKIKTKEGEGTVISVDILKRKYQVDIPDKGIIEIELDNGNN